MRLQRQEHQILNELMIFALDHIKAEREGKKLNRSIDGGFNDYIIKIPLNHVPIKTVFVLFFQTNKLGYMF